MHEVLVGCGAIVVLWDWNHNIVGRRFPTPRSWTMQPYPKFSKWLRWWSQGPQGCKTIWWYASGTTEKIWWRHCLPPPVVHWHLWPLCFSSLALVLGLLVVGTVNCVLYVWDEQKLSKSIIQDLKFWKKFFLKSINLDLKSKIWKIIPENPVEA